MDPKPPLWKEAGIVSILAYVVFKLLEMLEKTLLREALGAFF